MHNLTDYISIPGSKSCYLNKDSNVVQVCKKSGHIKTIKKYQYPREYIKTHIPGLGHISVHRLVAKLFVENPMNKPNVNHKNFDKHDNRLANRERFARG